MEAEYAAINKLVTTINMPYISEDERINAIADMFSYVAGTEYVLFDDKIRSRILRYVTNFIKPITTAAHNIAIVEPSVHKLCNRIQNEFDDIPPECERFVRFVQDLRNALPVGKAVESQDADTVTLALVRYPDTIDTHFMSQRINQMVTPLIQAVYDNQYNLSRKLLEIGADPNIPDEKGNTPIGYAVERLPYLEPGDNTKLAVLLASHGASVDESVYHTLLSSTAEYSAYVPVYTIVTDIVRILSDGNRPLNLPQNILERVAHHSVRNKRSNEFDVQSAYKELVELLIENGAFIHYNSHVLMDYIAANNLKNIFASFIHAMEVAKLNLTAAAMYENAIASADIKNKSDYKFEHIDGMTILTIPTGSLLYHSFNIPAKDDIESQTLKLMGGIVPNGSVVHVVGNKMKLTGCVDQFMQKFFYANPAGGYGLGSTTEASFNNVAVFETTRDMRFGVLMSPTNYHRLQGMQHYSKMPCNMLNPDVCMCSHSAAATQCPRAHGYDVCLTSEFLQKHALDGHVAIAMDDSYERKMKKRNSHFTRIHEEPYHQLNRIVVDGGRSTDLREEDRSEITGFPELVIHIFGTDWYNHSKSITYDYTIDLPNNHGPDERQQALSSFLINYNAGQLPSLGFHTSLKLIGNSTNFYWHNIMRLHRIPAAKRTPIFAEKEATTFYKNLLDAYISGDMQFYFDTRTGFLIRDGAPTPNIRLEDGSVITFKEASTRGGESASGTTVLEQSYVARRAGTFWPKEDCLIPAKDVPSRTRGGRRQTRRSSRRRKTRVQIPHNTAVPITNLVKWKNTRKNTVQNKLSAHNEPTAAATPASNKGKILDNIKVSLHYTPPPMTDEEREQIKHALSLPFDDPTNPTDMSAKTHALMHALLTVGKNPKPGQFKIV